MKTIFKDITARLKTVPALKWIDEDKGQMNFERPPVIFPCALIDIQLPKIENLNHTMQQCEALITVRLCFDFAGNTNDKTPAAALEKSLAYYDTVEAVGKALQGWTGGTFNPLSRRQFYQEKRPDAYKVVSIPFITQFREDFKTV